MGSEQKPGYDEASEQVVAEQTPPQPTVPGTYREPGQIARSSRWTFIDALLALTMIIWATNHSVAKVAVAELSPHVFNVLRFSLGALVLGFVVKAYGQKLALPRREWLPIILLACLNNALYQSFFLGGLRYTTVAHSVLIGTVAPLGVVLVNIWRNPQRGRRGVLIGGLLALGGVAFVIVSRFAGQFEFGSTTLLGDALTVIAAVIWVVNTLASRGPLQRNPALVASFWVLLWGIFWSGILALPDMLTLNLSVMRPDVIRGIVYSGIVSLAGAGTIWSLGIKRLGTSRTAIFVNLQPVIAAIIAAIFLGEQLTIALFLGTILVLTGMWLVRRG
jgi:drug/metabolite transporter (DMT)-like permease